MVRQPGFFDVEERLESHGEALGVLARDALPLEDNDAFRRRRCVDGFRQPVGLRDGHWQAEAAIEACLRRKGRGQVDAPLHARRQGA